MIAHSRHYNPYCVKFCICIATERKSWLLHYSLPVLRGVLKPIYCTHFALLATAIAILTAEVITTEDLEKADLLLMDFCTVFPELYGKLLRIYSMNTVCKVVFCLSAC